MQLDGHKKQCGLCCLLDSLRETEVSAAIEKNSAQAPPMEAERAAIVKKRSTRRGGPPKVTKTFTVAALFRAHGRCRLGCATWSLC